MRAVALVLVACGWTRVRSGNHSLRCQPPHRAGLNLVAPAPSANATMHDVAATLRHPSNGTDEPRAGRTYLFLLGYPQTGTSACHFWLATAPDVSALTDKFGPEKEGWSLDGLKDALGGKGRWRGHAGSDDCPARRALGASEAEMAAARYRRDYMGGGGTTAAIPWDHLNATYHAHWDLTKPILLENSPPEVLHAADLVRVFSRGGGDVRFVVLARSPCNVDGGPCDADGVAARLGRLRGVARAWGRRRVFVLRYEDLCFQTLRAAAALGHWLPGLGAIDVSAKPPAVGRNLGRHHERSSIPDFCYNTWLDKLPYERKRPFATTAPEEMRAVLDFFDYAVGVDAEPGNARAR